MKAKLFTAMIVCALLISLMGCSADKITLPPTHSVGGTMNTENATDPAERTEAVTPVAETAEKEMPVQPDATDVPQVSETAELVQARESEVSKQTEPSTQSEPIEAPKQESQIQPTESEQPAETAPEPTKPAEPSKEPEQPKPTEPPAPTEPTPTEPPAPTEPSAPTEPPAPVETEPPMEPQPKTAYDYEFDINAIRADCIAIGQSMGYTLNTSLTPQNATWWNPVTASESNQGSALRSALEQYIRFHTVSNLSAYGMDEITEFNICCESRGNGNYAIYFVFA